MILLISNNMRHIQRLYGKNTDIALSVESATNRISRNNYQNIIYDNIDISYLKDILVEKVPLVNYSDYIKRLVRSKKMYKQEVIAFWSVKGGVGKTSLILDLIDVIPKEIKVLIIDFNASNGGADISFMLSIPPVPHLGTYLDDKNLKENVIKVSQNVDILQAPPKVDFIKNMNEGHIIELLAQARAGYDMVLLDLPNTDNEIIKKIAQYSSKVLMVTKATAGELKRITEKNINCTLVVTNTKGYDKKLLKYIKLPWISVPTKTEAVKIYEHIYS